MQEVEIASIDLRYEGHRMRSVERERRLLVSIQERGIEEALEGVEVEGRPVLLDGFKRYRCARKLGLGQVPYVSLGEDEAAGVLVLLRTSNRTGLTVFEQACFVDDLHRLHGMTVAEIGRTLERSKSWVHARLGLLGEMSPRVRERILSGAFSAYVYLTTLRSYMRRDGSKGDVERFVEAVSGRGASGRELDLLAHGYFRGAAWFREAVEKGNLALPLERLREGPETLDGCAPAERAVLRHLDLLRTAMERVVAGSQDARGRSRAFDAQANLLVTQVLARMGDLTRALRELHDRTAQA